jgi:hypothetical protein
MVNSMCTSSFCQANTGFHVEQYGARNGLAVILAPLKTVYRKCNPAGQSIEVSGGFFTTHFEHSFRAPLPRLM